MCTILFENGFWSENISLKKILKLNVNLSSCLNLFWIWDLLKCMIAILLCKYCQQYLYTNVYKYCYSLLLNSWTLLIMIIFLFCYGVLMKLYFYLKNHNQLSKYIFFLTCLTFYRKTVIVELLHNTQTCLCNTHLQHLS